MREPDDGRAFIALWFLVTLVAIAGALTTYRYFYPLPPLPDMIAECKKIGGSVVLRQSSDDKLTFDRCILDKR